MGSREGLTLKDLLSPSIFTSKDNLLLLLLHPRKPGMHGAIMCTLQVQKQCYKQDSDYDAEGADVREQKQKQGREQEQEQGLGRDLDRGNPYSYFQLFLQIFEVPFGSDVEIPLWLSLRVKTRLVLLHG